MSLSTDKVFLVPRPCDDADRRTVCECRIDVG